MPVYQYVAINKSGRSLNGTMPAQNEVVLGEKLREADLWLTDADVQKKKTGGHHATLRRFKLRGKKGRRELIAFCTLMTYQVRVGITLVRALEAAAHDC